MANKSNSNNKPKENVKAPEKEPAENFVTSAATEPNADKVRVGVVEHDPHGYVVVRNGFHGSLTYKSKKTGELFKWEDFGSDQEMELVELKSARSSNKKFFENNWFMFDEAWVIDYLGVGQFYKNAIDIDNFDDIFSKNPSEIIRILNTMSDGQKKSISYRARELVASGQIDSKRAIAALEECLGIELSEK